MARCTVTYSIEVVRAAYRAYFWTRVSSPVQRHSQSAWSIRPIAPPKWKPPQTINMSFGQSPLTERKSLHESRRSLPLRTDYLRSTDRSQDSENLPLHGLPEPHRLSLPSHCRSTGDILRSVDWHSEDLYQDRRQRKQTSASVLPQLWHAYLCRSPTRHGQLRSSSGHAQAKGGTFSESTNLVSLSPTVDRRPSRH
jgi:hypothetical protein